MSGRRWGICCGRWECRCEQANTLGYDGALVRRALFVARRCERSLGNRQRANGTCRREHRPALSRRLDPFEQIQILILESEWLRFGRSAARRRGRPPTPGLSLHAMLSQHVFQRHRRPFVRFRLMDGLFLTLGYWLIIRLCESDRTFCRGFRQRFQELLDGRHIGIGKAVDQFVDALTIGHRPILRRGPPAVIPSSPCAPMRS